MGLPYILVYKLIRVLVELKKNGNKVSLFPQIQPT